MITQQDRNEKKLKNKGLSFNGANLEPRF